MDDEDGSSLQFPVARPPASQDKRAYEWLAIGTGECAKSLIAMETYAAVGQGLASGEYLV
jgi:hypothetical protein